MKRPEDEFVKRLAELIDGDSWALGDLLVEQFPTDEWGAAEHGRNTGIREELRRYENILARDMGLVNTGSTLRQARATAIAWPEDHRVSSVPFSVHRRMRGEDRFAEMRRRREQAKREGRALSVSMLSRLRYDEHPKTPKSFEQRMRRAITNAVRRELLGGIKADRADWWMAQNIVDEARAVAVRELRALASAINKGAIDA